MYSLASKINTKPSGKLLCSKSSFMAILLLSAKVVPTAISQTLLHPHI